MQPQQQQQTVVVPVQPTYVAQPYHTTSVVNTYRSGQSAAIGILLIIAGALSIIFNIVDLAVGSNELTYTITYHYGYEYIYDRKTVRIVPSEESLGVAGHGFWCGVMIIIAGGFGIGAARHKTRCMITAFMVLAIIGTLFGVVQAITAAVGAGNLRTDHDHFFELDCVGCDEVHTTYAMAILMAILGACEFALCLWGSILCCATGGCCGYYQPDVVTVPGAQPQVTVVSQQQPMQMIPMAQVPYDPQQPVVYYPAPPQYPAYPGYEQKS